ncbi:hypothetical protein H8D85_02410 [bacterium]|nr:hypothetical protein [bacterium]
MNRLQLRDEWLNNFRAKDKKSKNPFTDEQLQLMAIDMTRQPDTDRDKRIEEHFQHIVDMDTSDLKAMSKELDKLTAIKYEGEDIQHLLPVPKGEIK